jgi:purine-binding chemotaxis protein CheW
MEQQLVVFELAGEHFGVDISTVESIIKMQAITRMPHTPDFIEGITNLRGAILPVIDLSKRLGMDKHKQDERSERETRRIVVINIDRRLIGMIVDAVEEVLKINPETVSAPPPMVTSVNSAYVTGIAKVNERLVILLDLRMVLSTQESISLETL